MSEINILNLTSEERDRAYQKYKLIEAYLNNNCQLARRSIRDIFG